MTASYYVHSWEEKYKEQINVEPAGNLQIIHERQVLGKAFFIQSFEECLLFLFQKAKYF